MKKVTYEVIEATKVLDETGSPIRDLAVGSVISGEMNKIDGEPYLEILDDKEFVDAKALAQKLEEKTPSKGVSTPHATAKASNQKIIFALIGAGIGFGVAHFMKMDAKKKILFTVGGVVLGLTAEYVNNRKK